MQTILGAKVGRKATGWEAALGIEVEAKGIRQPPLLPSHRTIGLKVTSLSFNHGDANAL